MCELGFKVGKTKVTVVEEEGYMQLDGEDLEIVCNVYTVVHCRE